MSQRPAMPKLYTIGYLDVSGDAMEFMESFRREHDLPYRDVVAAHFTLAFGCDAIEEPAYAAHVSAICRASEAIRFSCRYAMLGADHFDDSAYVFIVPDEGYAGISLLHDRLYTGVLEPYLKLDAPYIPHITIGTTKDRAAAKALCDALNHDGIRIEGHVRALTVGAMHDGRIQNLSTHQLGDDP